MKTFTYDETCTINSLFIEGNSKKDVAYLFDMSKEDFSKKYESSLDEYFPEINQKKEEQKDLEIASGISTTVIAGALAYGAFCVFTGGLGIVGAGIAGGFGIAAGSTAVAAISGTAALVSATNAYDVYVKLSKEEE